MLYNDFDFSKNIKLLFRKVMERKNTWKNILLNDNSRPLKPKM